jgi:CRISPR/Cas system-associated exonuclease Cas4 (RecB family)
MDSRFKVSNSRIRLYRSCHFAHYLKYVKDLVKKVKSEPFQRGGLVHSAIESYHTGKSWKKVVSKFEEEFYDKTFSEERVELGDIPKMVRELLENYFYFYRHEDDQFKYLETELHFVLPLVGDIDIEGYIDGVVEDLDKNQIFGKEIKTYSRMPDRELLVFNIQSSIYLWALKQLDYSPRGILWDILKAKEPTKPKITQKKQELSLAKLDSTPYTVIKGIQELGLNPKDYEEFINKHSFDGYFIRYQVRHNPKVTKSIMEDTKATAKEIYFKGPKMKDKNLGKNCGWCSYKSICQAELMGLDTDYIIKADYQSREEGRNGNKEKKAKLRRKTR